MYNNFRTLGNNSLLLFQHSNKVNNNVFMVKNVHVIKIMFSLHTVLIAVTNVWFSKESVTIYSGYLWSDHNFCTVFTLYMTNKLQ